MTFHTINDTFQNNTFQLRRIRSARPNREALKMSTPQVDPALSKLWGQMRRIVERDVRVEIARRLAARGKMRRREIAEDIGVSRETLHRYLRQRE